MSANIPSPLPSALTFSHAPTIAFIGGGNMASAMIGGLLRAGLPATSIEVVEPWEPARAALHSTYGLEALAEAGPALERASTVVWAVKPQAFRGAALQTRNHTDGGTLHLSVAAGIRSGSIAHWLGSEQIVRCMPNTPALIGKGMGALYARPQVTAEQRKSAEAIMQSTGDLLWVEQEDQLDAVTALSGSGPAYVFYFLEAMERAGTQMGLAPEQARQLAIGTFAGASELAHSSGQSPELLRERVTSKGGTTHAAIELMEQEGVGEKFVRALRAAQQRAHELGDEFGT